MNMFPTFRQTSVLLESALKDEAIRCVRIHGRGGRGDPDGAANILNLKAAYVSTCVSCEQVRFPENTLASELQAHFTEAFEAWNAKL